MSEYSPKIKEAKVDYLHHEILLDIVLRLPIKSIITWTSVSKSWNSLIKNPNFISTHLNYNHTHTHLLLLGKDSWSHEEVGGEDVRHQIRLHWDNEAFDEYTRFDFPIRNNTVVNLVGTANGLVCIANFFNFFVWNPCIRKYMTIPTTNVHTQSFSDASTCNGFGFDSKANDYKIVRVVTRGNNRKSPPKVDVYSLGTGKWKMVTAEPPTCAIRYPGLQAFVNGALHWAASRRTNDGYRNFVLVFDLADEDFCEIMLPKDLLIEDESFHLSISVCGESLAAFHAMHSDNIIHVWVMQEYGVLESWTNVLTVDREGPEVQVPRIFDFLVDEDDLLIAVGFTKSGEVVIETGEGRLVSIDSESKQIKDLRNRIPGDGYSSIHPYVESLILLDKSDAAVSY